ncbi:MAG TPA: DUF2917 domain-containing protein [Ramlibacter sp.]|jgi:hypothetical protein
MLIPQVTALTPRCAEPTLPGTWKLAAGRAITLEPREPGILKVAHGRLWATFEGPHAGRLNESGDHFMGTGEQVRIAPGQRMVVEAWNEGCPAYFSWDPLPAPAPVRRTAADVAQPLSELRLAVVYGAHAASRLASGLAQIAWQSVFGPRVSHEEHMCTRHGALN